MEINHSSNNYYVEKIGEGDPLLFLPAGGFTGIEGLNIAEFVSDEFETHMVDLPGYGKSKGIDGKITSKKLANWVNDYIELQNIEKINLIGHSLGAAILLAFVNHYPEKVKKLILLDQGHKPFPRIPKTEFGLFAYAFPLLNMGVKLFGKRLLTKLEPLFIQDNRQERDVDKDVKQFCKQLSIEENLYIKKALRQEAKFSVEGLNLMFGYYNLNLPRMLRNVKVPTYLVYGTFENVSEKEYRNTERYMRKLKDYDLPITYFAVKGGHYVHWNNNFPMEDLKRFLIDTRITKGSRVNEMMSTGE
ncbi:alpha/beta hydrolase [Oceanobacillus sp. CAU 1775]